LKRAQEQRHCPIQAEYPTPILRIAPGGFNKLARNINAQLVWSLKIAQEQMYCPLQTDPGCL
jgi:hypothetical protein